MRYPCSQLEAALGPVTFRSEVATLTSIPPKSLKQTIGHTCYIFAEFGSIPYEPI